MGVDKLITGLGSWSSYTSVYAPTPPPLIGAVMFVGACLLRPMDNGDISVATHDNTFARVPTMLQLQLQYVPLNLAINLRCYPPAHVRCA